MNLNVKCDTSQLKKKVFNLKRGRKDGLVLQINYTSCCSKEIIRFTNVAFNESGQLLVASTFKGNIFVFNFTHNKFWHLMDANSCTFLKFNHRYDVIFIGNNNGALNIVDIESAAITARLEAHKFPVKDVSFARDLLCVTSSLSEAIVWDLNTYTKVQTLSLSSSTVLKQIMFMPVSDNILACFNDDSIHVWKYGSFEYLTQILPASWNKFHVKCITFTKNGRIMVLGGFSSQIAVFLVDTWELQKSITLPNQITGVKKLDFVSQPFDGGSNRVLTILSSNGILYFYDMQLDVIINQLAYDVEISKYDTSGDGRYIACISTGGKINIHLLAQYVSVQLDVSKDNLMKGGNKVKLKVHVSKKAVAVLTDIKGKIDDVLDSQKLVSILKEFWQYPDAYRLKIWTQLLQLPNNVHQYHILNNKYIETQVHDLDKKYPMENKLALKNLKKLMFNLTLWCPFFGEVSYLPLFAFPFVKVFQNDPVLCFEAVLTIIVNWCQYWFEYYPLPPINILAMTENVLLQHDPSLLAHLTTYEVTSKLYAWPLMETALSEVFSSQDWLILWDHILSSEPSFFIMVVVAYSVIQKQTLLSLTDPKDFETFYHKQNLVCVKKLTSKAYQLLEATAEKSHPRVYLEFFRKIEVGSYPQFLGYPRAVVDYEHNVKDLKKVQRLTERHEKEFMQRTGPDRERMEAARRKIEECIRMREVDRIYQKKLEEDKEVITKQRFKLEQLKRIFDEEELGSVGSSFCSGCFRTGKLLVEFASEVKPSDDMPPSFHVKLENSNALEMYWQFLETSYMVQAYMVKDFENVPIPHSFHHAIDKKLMEAISESKTVTNGEQYLAQLAATTGIALLEKLIGQVRKRIKKCSQEKKENIVQDDFVSFMMEQINITEGRVEAAIELLSTMQDDCNEGNHLVTLRQLYQQIKSTGGPSAPS